MEGSGALLNARVAMVLAVPRERREFTLLEIVQDRLL
jgi:hypothetical protein